MNKHKRHFQLLELLVAVSILLLCVGPTIRIFSNIYKGQQQIIRENFRDHLANKIHSVYTESLYKNEIQLFESDEGIPLSVKDPDLLDVLRKSHCTLTGNFRVTDKIKGEKEIQYLSLLQFQLEDQFPILTGHVEKNDKYDPIKGKYEYTIFITRSPNENDNTNVSANAKESQNVLESPSKTRKANSRKGKNAAL